MSFMTSWVTNFTWLHGVCRRGHGTFRISLTFNNFLRRLRMSRLTSLLLFKAQLQKIEIWEDKTLFWRGSRHFLALNIASPFPAQPPLLCGVHMDEVYGNICSSNISKYLPCAFQCNIINFTKLPFSVSASCPWVSKALGSDKWALVLALRRSKVRVRSGPLLCGRDKLI